MYTKSENKREKKEKFIIKSARISVFSIILIMLMCVVGDAIAKYGDAVKIRIILYKTLPVILFSYILLIIILAKVPKLAAKRLTILDILSIVMFIILMVLLRKEVLISSEMGNSFLGNNIYFGFYSNGIGGYEGYDDIEKALEDKIEYVKRTGNHNDFEEIYRVQTGEKIFVYCKVVDEKSIAEYDFVKQDDLYYCLGEMYVEYNWIGNDYYSYTEEDTIRKDIAYTMWREGVRKLTGAPAWGVSADENIFSMAINSENVDDVILVDEIDGKKYYFWIVTNTGGIETIEDVLEAEIHMDVR